MQTLSKHPFTAWVALALFSASGQALADDRPVRQESSFRLEFLGKNPASDWAKAVNTLIDQDVVPIETLILEKGQDPCNAVLRRLRFTEVGLGCPDELKDVLKKLNPKLRSPPQVGDLVNYPNLPVEQMTWRAGFDSSIPEDRDRLIKVRELWKDRKIDEKTAGSQKTLELKGIATELKVPTTPRNYRLLEKVERYNPDIDRLETRAVAREFEPSIKQRFSVNTPIGWAQACLTPPTPVAAAPPYISLLNATANPTCATTCTQPGRTGCPEIVLIDQPVDPHPELAGSLQLPATSPAGSWCPFGAYDRTRNHGTHLAGIMVGAGSATGFRGLAPNVSLDSRPISDSAIKSLMDDKTNAPGLKIFVYAGKFTNDYSIQSTETRRHKPSQVEDMLNSMGLWIVAAGQEPTVDIGKLTAHSPMNLGDQKNVLVVTSCEDCYKPGAKISDWANYSTEGLVTVAAPGGSPSDKIPSTIDSNRFGIAFGTSQATALVAGLAAGMASCYPQRYANGSFLKQRLEAIARPAPSLEMSERLSAGVIDALYAFRDPDLQLVKLTDDTVKTAKTVQFCTSSIRLKKVADPGGEEIGPIAVKKIRAIFREMAPNGEPGWRVRYQPKALASLVTTPLVDFIPDGAWDTDKPLFYAEGSTDLSIDPINLKQIDSLILGLQGGTVPPGFKGCK